MVSTTAKVQYKARLMGVRLAPASGESSRLIRAAVRTLGSTRPSRQRASAPDARSVYRPDTVVVEVDQGPGERSSQLFGKLYRAIFLRLRSMLAAVRLNAKHLTAPLNQRPTDVLAPQNHAQAGDVSGLCFAQLRELARVSPCCDGAGSDEVCENGRKFRMLRASMRLTRVQAAEYLNCEEASILVLENGYGNLETSRDLLKRLQRMVEQSADA